MSFLTALFFVSMVGWSQNNPPAVPVGGGATPVIEPTTEIEKIQAQSLLSRQEARASVLVHFAPYDLLLPGKIGATVGWHRDNGHTLYEFEYLRAKMSVPALIDDIGSLTEQRFSLTRRSFSHRESFNWFWGLNYNSLDITLGSDYLAAVGGNTRYELLQITSLGAHVGLGNRWYITKNVHFAIDWFTWSQPLFILSKKADYLDAATAGGRRDDVDTAMNLAAVFPRFSLLKLGLGASF